VKKIKNKLKKVITTFIHTNELPPFLMKRGLALIAFSLYAVTASEALADDIITVKRPSRYKPRVVHLEKKYIRVIDGDSIKYEHPKTPLTLRLLGADTPESSYHPNKPDQRGIGAYQGYPFARDAAAIVEIAVQSAKDIDAIILRKDYYNRDLSVILIDNIILQQRLIEEGLAYRTSIAKADRIIIHHGKHYIDFYQNMEQTWKAACADPQVDVHKRFRHPKTWRKNQKKARRKKS
jgi:endonuclease YncB( thermonuclease family)